MPSEVIVSVILPVYNAELYIIEALKSILDQTYSNTEVLIFDDCSNDNSIEAIYSITDDRVKLEESKENKGYTYWLNEGLKRASGKYIARMDADDISDITRFEKQVSLLEANENIGLVGTNCLFIDGEGRVLRLKETPKSDEEIRWTLMLDNPFIHPSVMFRAEIIRAKQLYYDTEFQPTEDYLMWTNILRYCQGANIQEPLIKYRIHDGQISFEKRTDQLDRHDQVLKNHLRHDYGNGSDLMPIEYLKDLRRFTQGGLMHEYVEKAEINRFVSDYAKLFNFYADKIAIRSERNSVSGVERSRVQAMAMLLRSLDKAKGINYRLLLLLACIRNWNDFLFFYLKSRFRKIKGHTYLYKN